MKDYYDIYYLETTENFDAPILWEAIHSAFENRRHFDFIKNIHELSKYNQIYTDKSNNTKTITIAK